MTNAILTKLFSLKIVVFKLFRKENSTKQKQNRTSIIQNTLNNIMFKRL